jgi:hypothetical protein
MIASGVTASHALRERPLIGNFNHCFIASKSGLIFLYEFLSGQPD